MASIILDFKKVQKVHLDGRTWSVDTFQHYYGGSDFWPAFAISEHNSDTGDYGAIKVLFRGTSIAFFGTTPFPKCSQYLSVSIDGGGTYNAFFQDPTPPSEQQWYQTPLLEDTQHTVTLTRIPAVSFDYVVITAGQDTPLDDQLLILDDGDTSISYAGHWNRNDARYVRDFRRDIVEGYSYGNATHDTSTSGSSATVTFSGSSPALYGTIDYSNFGKVSAKYTLDGVITTKDYLSTSEIRRTDVIFGNNLLFSDDSISPGDHILKIEVIDCINQTFSLDYFTYSPSFKTLAEKPHSTNGTVPSITHTTTQATTSKTSEIISGSISRTTPSSISGPTSSPISSPISSSTSGPTSGSNKDVPIGVVVGSTVGGVVALALFLLFLLCRRKISRRFFTEKASSTPTGGLLTPEPFTSAPPPLSSPYVYSPLHKEAIPATSKLGDNSMASGRTNSPTTPYTGAMIADHKAHYPQGHGSNERVYSLSPPPYQV